MSANDCDFPGYIEDANGNCYLPTNEKGSGDLTSTEKLEPETCQYMDTQDYDTDCCKAYPELCESQQVTAEEGSNDGKELTQEKCETSFGRDCRKECDGLPSYPTYEFEDCLTQCNSKNAEDVAKSEQCAEQQSPSETIEVTSEKIDLKKLSDEISGQFPLINNIFKEISGGNAKITSGYRDSKPGEKFSYHQTGDAVDLRINDIENQTKVVDIYNRLRNEIGKEYDVCLEVPDPSLLPASLSGCILKNKEPHIHVEYNRPMEKPSSTKKTDKGDSQKEQQKDNSSFFGMVKSFFSGFFKNIKRIF